MRIQRKSIQVPLLMAAATAVAILAAGLSSAAPAIPSGAVLFFNLDQCPDGWDDVHSSLIGRYFVGGPPVVGADDLVGTALDTLDSENRAVGGHDHAIVDPGHDHGRTQYWVFSFLSGRGDFDSLSPWTSVQETSHTGSAKSNVVVREIMGAESGTNAPYLQLLACRRQ